MRDIQAAKFSHQYLLQKYPGDPFLNELKADRNHETLSGTIKKHRFNIFGITVMPLSKKNILINVYRMPSSEYIHQCRFIFLHMRWGIGSLTVNVRYLECNDASFPIGIRRGANRR